MQKVKKTNNFTRKIYSTLIAVIIWIIIYNIYDPIITTKIDNIPVKIINEDAITDLGKVYTIDENENIEIYVTGKQSLVKNLTSNDITATANLKDLSITNSVGINVQIPKLSNEDIKINYEKNNNIHISLDNYVSRTFSLKVKKENTLNEKYYLEDDNCYEQIKISGPQQKINQIAEVYILVDESNLYPGSKKTYPIQIADNFGENIDSRQFTFSKEMYNYEPTIYNIQEAKININCVGNIPFGYSLNSETYIPQTIKISGPKELLKKYETINISYNVSNLNSSQNVILNLKDYLPEEIRIISDSSEITLTLTVEKLTLKEYVFDAKELTIKNLAENYTYKYETIDKIKITVMGEETFLSNLTIDKIAPFIDLENKEEGTYSVEIKIPEALNLDLISISTIEVSILAPKEDNAQNNEENNSNENNENDEENEENNSNKENEENNIETETTTVVTSTETTYESIESTSSTEIIIKPNN